MPITGGFLLIGGLGDADTLVSRGFGSSSAPAGPVRSNLLTRGLGVGHRLVTRGLIGPTGSDEEETTVYGSTEIYADMLARLRALGLFASAELGVWQEKGRFALPAALIRPISEIERQSGGAPINYDVDCTYELVIVASFQHEADRHNQIRLLAAASQNALTGVRLGQATRPALTTLGGVRHEPRPSHPYGKAFLTGSFQFNTATANRPEASI